MMMKMRGFLTIVIAIFVLSLNSFSQAFYLPGVAPYSFADDEVVDLKVNKLR